MGRFRFPIAVAVTSLALVAIVGAAGVLYVQNALAKTPLAAAAQFGPGAFGSSNFQLPPQLQGLQNLPPAQRFSHFVGVQVNLKDQNNQPLTVNIIPGTVTTASAGSLTIAANDGTTKSFTLNSNTIIHGTQGGQQSNPPTLTKDDRVIVVILDNDTTALTVVDGGPNGFQGAGPRGQGGPPWAHGGPWGWHQ